MREIVVGEPLFGELLRRHRLHAALSQEELAEAAALSVRTIRNLESGSIRSPRLRTVLLLVDALALQGDERRAFEQAAWNVEPASPTLRVSAGSLPSPLTRFVGRDDEFRAVVELVSDPACRLVTLTGVAGVGKTRLALAVAAEFRAGGAPVWWVPLISLNDSGLVLDAIAEAVGAHDSSLDAVAAAVQAERAVLMVDNLEHLDGVGTVLAELLANAPGLTVLATSRAPTGVIGEHECSVSPLAVPDNSSVDADELAQVPSVQLLVDRCRAWDPDFQVVDAVSDRVAEICRRLDGIPLALELAARQMRVLDVVGVLDAIDRRPLDLRNVATDRPSHHASLRTALNASYQLLSRPERVQYQQLTVFDGGWTIDAAVDVIEGDAVAGLDRLVSLGLVNAVDEPGGGRRFTMLQTVAAFAAELARATGVDEGATKRHAEYYAALAACNEPRLLTASASDALQQLDRERDNLRAALSWYVRNDPDAGLAMALSLWWFWHFRRRNDEGIAWFQAMLEHATDGAAAVQGRALMASLAHLGDRPDARPTAEAALAEARRLGEPVPLARALVVLGSSLAAHGRLAEAEQLVIEAVTIADGLGDPWLMATSRTCLLNTLTPDRLDEAATHGERALEVARAAEYAYYEAVILYDMAAFAQAAGELDVAERYLRETERLLPTLHTFEIDVRHPALSAIVAAQRGDVERAESLCRCAEAAVERSNEHGRRCARWVEAGVMLARAEVLLAQDRPATTAFARALSASRWGQRLVQIQALAGAAAAADEPRRAAIAIVATTRRAAVTGLDIPEPVSRRLQAVEDRWAAEVGQEIWQQHLDQAASEDADTIMNVLRHR